MNVLCFGNATGSIDLSVSGGTGPYTYLWSTGAVTQDLANLVAGTYTVTVTDSKGCTTTLSITITQPVAPLSSSMVETNIDCFGNSTGAVNLSVSGGTVPYSYSWSNASLNEDISGLLPGQYIVTITDNNGCMLKDTANLTQPLAPLAISLTKDDADCFGASDGSIDATVTGGTTPYSYSWSNGQATQDIQNLVAGTYVLQVTDFNGCQTSTSSIISQPSQIAMTSTQVNVLCYGDATGSINLSVIGGISPYQFSWSNGPTSEDISNLTAGSYTVTTTDANNCSVNYTATILQPLQPLTLSITNTDALCVGAQQGTTNLTISGGTAPYSQIWNNNQTAEDLVNLVAGYYYATVTDNNGCSDTIGATILDPSNTMTPTILNTDVSCFGGSDGTVDLTVTGGLLPYSYAWNTGSGSEDLSSLPTGNYFVTITDGNSCQSFISAFVDQPQAPLTATQQVTNVLCFNDATGAIDISTSGGTQPYSFSWNSGQITEDLVNVLAGSYQLTITDAKNCLLVVNPQITQPSDIQLSAIKQDINCFGQSTGWIDLSVSGGVMPYSYSWDSGQNTQDLSALPAGIYQVHVTDGNQCQDSLTMTLTQPAAPLQVSAVTNNISCFGGNDGSIDITIGGGTTPYAFNWSNAALTQDQQNLYAGIYQINITDNNGCTTIGNYNLTQPAQPLSTQMTMTEPLCNGNSNATATVIASGGTAPLTYSINGTTFVSSNTFNGLSAGTYTVTVKDANGCQQTFNTTITEPAPLSLTCVPTVSNGTNGTITVTGSGGNLPYSYSLNGTNYYSGSLFSGLAIGVYTVYIKDANGCVTSMEVNINSNGIEELGFTLVNIYPNPNKGVFELEVDGISDSKVAGKLFNVSGQLVSSFELTAQNGKIKETIEMSKKLAAGTYYLGLYQDNKAVVKQFIKE